MRRLTSLKLDLQAARSRRRRGDAAAAEAPLDADEPRGASGRDAGEDPAKTNTSVHLPRWRPRRRTRARPRPARRRSLVGRPRSSPRSGSPRLQDVRLLDVSDARRATRVLQASSGGSVPSLGRRREGPGLGGTRRSSAPRGWRGEDPILKRAVAIQNAGIRSSAAGQIVALQRACARTRSSCRFRRDRTTLGLHLKEAPGAASSPVCSRRRPGGFEKTLRTLSDLVSRSPSRIRAGERTGRRQARALALYHRETPRGDFA